MKATKINYVNGDATLCHGPGQKIIAHICNDIGAWGRGFVLSLSRAHPAAETAYRSWYQENPEWHEPFERGSVQFVKTRLDVQVANMIAQAGIFPVGGKPPIRYKSLIACLVQVCDMALFKKASVHMPRIGCGLAGGEWSKIEPLVVKHLCEKGIEVFVYDFEPGDARQISWKK